MRQVEIGALELRAIEADTEDVACSHKCEHEDDDLGGTRRSRPVAASTDRFPTPAESDIPRSRLAGLGSPQCQ